MKTKHKTRLTAHTLQRLEAITPGVLLYRRFTSEFYKTLFVLEFDYNELFVKFVAWDIERGLRCSYEEMFVTAFLDAWTTDPSKVCSHEE